ncbi:MAG: ABC transporter ATP-binding protein [Anaerolineales bacterium]|nr:ABC transporter ATP-binding protein [Anaerolineales bacterium]
MLVNTRTNDSTFDMQSAISNNRLVGLWRLMKGYRLVYLGATATLALAATAKTLTYLLLRYFVDQVLGRGRPEILPWIGLGFLGLAALEGTFTFISGRQAAYTGEGVARRMRNYIYDHLQRLSFSYHAKAPTGDLIQRATSDVDALRKFYSDQAIGVGRIVLLFTINFVALLALYWPLALASIIVVPFVILTSVWFFKRVNTAYEAFQAQEAILSTTLQENLTGVRVVKAFARQVYEKDKFEKVNFEKYQRGKKLLVLHALFWPVSDILCGAQMLGGFTVGAILAINGTITPGTYLAYAGLIVWLIFPMRMLGRLIVQTSTGLVSYERVMTVLREAREPLDEGDYQPAGDVAGAVTFDHVSFEYEEQLPVLRDVSFSCAPGQVVALLGATGSGKTSLVNLLPRFYEATSGTITLDGVDLRRFPRRYLRRQIGIVQQEPFLFSRSLRENIAYGVGRAVTQAEIETAARAAAIHEAIVAFPRGYDTIVGEKGVTLSGGQKQRVAIARTLLKNPRILIMDDSTSAVDTETEAEIRAALDQLAQNRTTFIIAHRIQSVMAADLILVLDKGHVAQHGTHRQLLEQDGIYRQIYDIQTRIEEELERDIAGAEAVLEPLAPVVEG